ncbi:sensor domain-containing diguanylate cyclase [Azohydromonas lata]|uniref:diguanylate cyclase n=1 Tax=Azohydromonas lata TaxID=45677 RepID=A0ABU5IKB8_9BURK|nr:GGDEF domain-containing protein [Azohydromonas lata]MDZ5459331.1 GGDEF domain-containing protein [Azohydromonas lata]
MEQIASFFDTLDDLNELLSSPALRGKVARSRSVLAQVFVSSSGGSLAQAAAARVAALEGRVVVVGASTCGEICGGRARSASNVLSLLLFDAAELRAEAYAATPGSEAALAGRIAEGIARAGDAPLKGVLLLSTSGTVEAGALLRALHGRLPGLPLFGAGAGDGLEQGRTVVLCGTRTLEAGCIAVGLYGHALEVMRQTYLGWEPMGKRMRATRAAGCVMHTIDDQPAMEVYRHYLGIEGNDRLFHNAMEFPFLVEREGELLARVPHKALPDGAIEFIGDVREGEELRFGYANVDGILARARGTQAEVRAFAPQAILFYSCICRYFVMQKDVELELRPYEAMAPTAGFFTYGEFCDLGSSSPMMTSTLLVVALREGAGQSGVPQAPMAGAPAAALCESSHSRILSRFQHFVRAIAGDLERANDELLALAEHDALTGLVNRRKLQALLAAEALRARRHGDDFCVLLGDIDHFKHINDNFGHEAGDAVLRLVAHTLASQVRGVDTVCRWGGEEFVVLLPQTHLEEAMQCAERLRRCVEALYDEGDSPLPRRVTLSLGVAAYPRHGDVQTPLLAAADKALYEAKHGGRNQVRAGQDA